MKITASKRDDLMRARYDYDSLTQKYEDVVDEGQRKGRRAKDQVAAGIEDVVRTTLGPTSIDLDFDVREDWDYNNGKEYKSWKVSVQAHEHDKHTNDASALAWNWSAKLGSDGQVIKDSGSWSGLQAITPAQIADLEESVRILKLLNNMDWSAVLSQAIPSYNDYIDKEASDVLRDRKKNRPNFDAQIFEAELEDAIADGAWIKMNGRPGTDYYREASRGDYFVKIDSMTDKFVKCHITRDPGNDSYQTDERIGKAKLFSYIKKPIETV